MYSIQQVSKQTGLSEHTLRFYEKEGLLPPIQRTGGGIRQYSEENMETLGLICCLKNTGMPLGEITRFVRLAREGNQTLKERVDLLREHRDSVVQRIEEMQEYLNKVTWKLNYFSEKLRAYEEQNRKEETL